MEGAANVYLDDGSEVVGRLDDHHLETNHIRLALCAVIPDHVTLEIVALLRRQLYTQTHSLTHRLIHD